MNVFDVSPSSERMKSGGGSPCRVGEQTKQYARSDYPAECRKEKRRNYFESKKIFGGIAHGGNADWDAPDHEPDGICLQRLRHGG